MTNNSHEIMRIKKWWIIEIDNYRKIYEWLANLRIKQTKIEIKSNTPNNRSEFWKVLRSVFKICKRNQFLWKVLLRITFFSLLVFPYQKIIWAVTKRTPSSRPERAARSMRNSVERQLCRIRAALPMHSQAQHITVLNVHHPPISACALNCWWLIEIWFRIFSD